MSARHTPLAELTNDDLLRIANEYRAMALTASTAADRDELERVAAGFERIVERRMRMRPHD
jgi:HAMP domain-containing protein